MQCRFDDAPGQIEDMDDADMRIAAADFQVHPVLDAFEYLEDVGVARAVDRRGAQDGDRQIGHIFPGHRFSLHFAGAIIGDRRHFAGFVQQGALRRGTNRRLAADINHFFNIRIHRLDGLHQVAGRLHIAGIKILDAKRLGDPADVKHIIGRLYSILKTFCIQ